VNIRFIVPVRKRSEKPDRYLRTYRRIHRRNIHIVIYKDVIYKDVIYKDVIYIDVI